MVNMLICFLWERLELYFGLSLLILNMFLKINSELIYGEINHTLETHKFMEKANFYVSEYPKA